MEHVGPCGLCSNARPLRRSHLVSEFIERRLKLDAGTPFLRTANPNQRVQGGPRKRLLCGDCEDRFSAAEDEFAREFYHPTLDGNRLEIVWTRGLARFLASITWRNLIDTLGSGRAHSLDYRLEDVARMRSSEERLRHYLLDAIPYPREVEHHVFVAGANAHVDRDGINTFLNMAIATGLPATNEALYSVTVVPAMVFVALLHATDYRRSLWRKGTLAEPGGVLRNHRQTVEDGDLGYWLVTQAEAFANQRDEMSPRQRAIIAKAARANVAVKRHGSRIARAWLQDDANRKLGRA